MSSAALPSRGQCIEITDNLQLCQCLSFASTLDQNICGRCGHGIHAHVDYISMFVHQCAAMNCAAYYPKTPRVQACTCSASLIEHIPVVNVYRSPASSPNVDNALPSNVNTFTGDVTNIPFTQVPMPAPSTNNTPSYSYGDVPLIHTATTLINAHSHPGVEDFYAAQHQDSVNVQDSSARFREDYPIAIYSTAHGAEAWAGQLR